MAAEEDEGPPEGLLPASAMEGDFCRWGRGWTPLVQLEALEQQRRMNRALP